MWWRRPLSGSEPVLAVRLTRFINGTLVGGSVLANYFFMALHRHDVGVIDEN